MERLMTEQQMKQVAEQIRQARRNPQRLTRERALKLFEQHRQAAASSRLSLKLSSSGAAMPG